MTINVLNIPEDAAELARWLERSLVGVHLGEIIRELCVIHEQTPHVADADTLGAWLGDRSSQILANGLQSVPVEKLGQLLAQPSLLLAVQDFVLSHDSDYWRRLARSGDNNEAATLAEKVQQRVTSSWSGESTVDVATTALSARTSRVVPYWLPALAAALLVALGVYMFRSPTTAHWGWNQPDLLSQRQQTPGGYLNALAAAGNEWFDERPTTADEIKRRIEEMRAGCDRLIAAPHPVLADSDRKWLIERCQAWRGKFEEQLAALKSDADAIRARDVIDGVVRQLVEKLHERAGQA